MSGRPQGQKPRATGKRVDRFTSFAATGTRHGTGMGMGIGWMDGHSCRRTLSDLAVWVDTSRSLPLRLRSGPMWSIRKLPGQVLPRQSRWFGDKMEDEESGSMGNAYRDATALAVGTLWPAGASAGAGTGTGTGCRTQDTGHRTLRHLTLASRQDTVLFS